MSNAREKTYDYDDEGQHRIDDKHAHRARDLARAGIHDEARREAAKIVHYRRSMDLIDEVGR